MGVCFFVCDPQCDLLIYGCRLSPPMSVALSGYSVSTVISIERRFSILRLKSSFYWFFALNIVLVESVLPGYVPTLRVNVVLPSRVLVENNQCQLFHLAYASQCLW